MNKIPSSFIFPKIEQLKSENNTQIIKSEIVESQTNNTAWMERGYNNTRNEYYMLNSNFDLGISKWIKDVPVHLIKGRGIPTSLYLDLRAMKLLNIPPKSIEYFIIYNIHEWDSIFKLHILIKNNPEKEISDLFKRTRIFQSRENVIIQTGHIIEDIKIILDDSKFTYTNELVNHGISSDILQNLCNYYNVKNDEEIWWNFSIVLKVKNACS